MSKREPKRAVSTHRQSRNAARLTAANYAELRFNLRHEFGEEEVAVALLAVGGVDKERGASFNRNDQEIANGVVLAQVFDQTPPAAQHERLLVLPEPVEEIENRIFTVVLSLVARRQHRAVADGPLQDLAVHAAAVDTALRNRGTSVAEQHGCNDEHASLRRDFQGRTAHAHSYRSACTGSSFAARAAG